MRIDYQYWNDYPAVGEPDENTGADEGERFYIPQCYAATYQVYDDNDRVIAEDDFPHTGFSYILEDRKLKQFGRRGGVRIVRSF